MKTIFPRAAYNKSAGRIYLNRFIIDRPVVARPAAGLPAGTAGAKRRAVDGPGVRRTGRTSSQGFLPYRYGFNVFFRFSEKRRDQRAADVQRLSRTSGRDAPTAGTIFILHTILKIYFYISKSGDKQWQNFAGLSLGACQLGFLGRESWAPDDFDSRPLHPRYPHWNSLLRATKVLFIAGGTEVIRYFMGMLCQRSDGCF